MYMWNSKRGVDQLNVLQVGQGFPLPLSDLCVPAPLPLGHWPFGKQGQIKLELLHLLIVECFKGNP